MLGHLSFVDDKRYDTHQNLLERNGREYEPSSLVAASCRH
jgi:hypothetical protein